MCGKKTSEWPDEDIHVLLKINVASDLEASQIKHPKISKRCHIQTKKEINSNRAQIQLDTDFS